MTGPDLGTKLTGILVRGASSMRRLRFPVVFASCVTLASSSMVGTSLSYSVVDIGTLGGSLSASVAINERGAVVGASEISGDTDLHAFLYQDGALQDVGATVGSA